MQVIDVLATARLIRAVRRETITEPLREAIVREAYVARGAALSDLGVTTWTDYATVDNDPPMIAELLDCSWCLGFWCAGFVVAARRWAPGLWDPLARVLAVSLLGSVIELAADRA